MSVTASKKVLVPLATLLAAGAVAVGSGATFTSTTENEISSVTSGTLEHINSKDGQAVFNLDNMKPGDTRSGALTITNTGSLESALSLTEVASTNKFSGEFLTLSITNTATNASVYTGTFGELVDGAKQDLGEIKPGDSNEYRFTVHLAQDAPNSEQGKTASASYQWDTVQLAGETTGQ